MQTMILNRTETLYKFLKDDKSGIFAGSHDIHTPKELVEEILDQIPNLTVNKKILVLFNVEFIVSLVDTFNVNNNNITFYSDHDNKTKIANRIGVNVITNLEKLKMKFDVVVGNPPFQKSNNDAKRWTLWEQFVKKALELSCDTVAMITPQSITSPGPFSLIKDRATIINTNISKHFNVGSTFAYFVMSDSINQSTAKIISSNGEYYCDLKNIDFLPFLINEDTLSQIEWLKSRTSRTWKRGELHTSKKELFNDSGEYDVIHTNAQTLKSSTVHENLSKIRVCVTLSGYPKFMVITNTYCSQATMWTEFKTMKEAKQFAKECNGNLIQEIMTNFKWSGWNSKEVIECL
jgi:23S rRNA A1618 N6-methylase RlmF